MPSALKYFFPVFHVEPSICLSVYLSIQLTSIRDMARYIREYIIDFSCHNFHWRWLSCRRIFMSLPGVLQVPERKSLSLIYPFFLSTPGSSPNKTKTQPFVVFRELKATSQSPDQTDAQLANYKGLELHLIRRRALAKRRNLVLGSVWVDTDF